MTNFGRKLKELRLRGNLSLRDLGERSGVSYSFIGSLESGRFNPSRETVVSLAKALGADENEFLLLAGFSSIALDGNRINEQKESKSYLAKRIDEEIQGVSEETQKIILDLILSFKNR